MLRIETAAARRRTPPDASKTGVRSRHIIDSEAAPLILVVDDAEDSRILYAESLAEVGFRTTEAVDGEHALFKVSALRPSLVVMDLAMPVLDGIEATKKIKRDPKTAHIPVIILTGHGTAENRERVKAVGADAIVRKPCEPDALLRVVKRLLKV
jgi:CheY-like chemotaxis protein